MRKNKIFVNEKRFWESKFRGKIIVANLFRFYFSEEFFSTRKLSSSFANQKPPKALLRSKNY
jgi:hypothetical protein